VGRGYPEDTGVYLSYDAAVWADFQEYSSVTIADLHNGVVFPASHPALWKRPRLALVGPDERLPVEGLDIALLNWYYELNLYEMWLCGEDVMTERSHMPECQRADWVPLDWPRRLCRHHLKDSRGRSAVDRRIAELQERIDEEPDDRVARAELDYRHRDQQYMELYLGSEGGEAPTLRDNSLYLFKAMRLASVTTMSGAQERDIMECISRITSMFQELAEMSPPEVYEVLRDNMDASRESFTQCPSLYMHMYETWEELVLSGRLWKGNFGIVTPVLVEDGRIAAAKLQESNLPRIFNIGGYLTWPYSKRVVRSLRQDLLELDGPWVPMPLAEMLRLQRDIPLAILRHHVSHGAENVSSSDARAYFSGNQELRDKYRVLVEDRAPVTRLAHGPRDLGERMRDVIVRAVEKCHPGRVAAAHKRPRGEGTGFGILTSQVQQPVQASDQGNGQPAGPPGEGSAGANA
jgi:hypothetical protein